VRRGALRSAGGRGACGALGGEAARGAAAASERSEGASCAAGPRNFGPCAESARRRVCCTKLRASSSRQVQRAAAPRGAHLFSEVDPRPLYPPPPQTGKKKTKHASSFASVACDSTYLAARAIDSALPDSCANSSRNLMSIGARKNSLRMWPSSAFYRCPFNNGMACSLVPQL
jgi:hypothetical protein